MAEWYDYFISVHFDGQEYISNEFQLIDTRGPFYKYEF